MSVRARFDRLPGVVRGGFWMMSAALCFTVMTALIRVVAHQINPVEIAFFRAATNLVLMLPFACRMGRGLFRSSNHRVYAFRGLVGFTFVMSYSPGAALIPVAESQSLIFTEPLWATMMTAMFLGERLFRHRAFALIVGFADATAVLPFDFERLPFAGIIGVVALAELPDPWVWAGGVVIFGAPVYLARREARSARAPSP